MPTHGEEVTHKEPKLNKRARRAQEKHEKRQQEAQNNSSPSSLRFVRLDEITVGERFRQEYNLEDLVESVQEKGIVQPITLDEKLNLVAGGRRLAAAKAAGLEEVPALIRHIPDEITHREIELLENVQRKDLNWMERTRLTREIDDLYTRKHGQASTKPGEGWSGRKTAELLSRSHGSVQRTLALARGLDLVPALSECKTEQEAFKMLKQLEESALVKQMRKQQEATLEGYVDDEEDGDEEAPSPATLEARVLKRLSLAKNHFRIGDAFDGLQELVEIYSSQQSGIRFIEVDPPYGISLAEQKKRVNKEKPHTLDKYEEIEATKYLEFLSRLCPLLYSVAANDCWMVFWFGPSWTSEVRTALESAGWSVDHIPAVWVKGSEESSGSGQTGSPERYLARATEFFFVCRKGNPLLGKEGRTNVFYFTPEMPSRKYHPTQKPIPLYRDILRTFTFPNGVMLCPFLGSGSTLRAAYLEGVLGFGWDLNKHNKERFLVEVEEDMHKEEKADADDK